MGTGAEMNTPPYTIGETVFIGLATPYGQEQVPCPICFGKGAVTLILGNGEHQPVECEFCRCGLERATGLVLRYAPRSEVKRGAVTGLNERYGEWKVEVDGWMQDVDHIFRDPKSAEICRIRLHAEAEKQAQQNFESQFKGAKKKTTWNAGYHRKEIQELERKLEWHRARLAKPSEVSGAQESPKGEEE